MAFIQWNIRGLQANRQELSLLLSHTDADLVCLQETFVPKTTNICFKNYCFYGNNTNSPSDISSTTHGGVAILVKHSTPHKQFALQTSLEAVAIRVTCNKTFTVCSVYLSPSRTYDSRELCDLIDQLPQPLLLLGDFNAHSTLWGGRKTDTRGKHQMIKVIALTITIMNEKGKNYVKTMLQR